MVKARPLNSVFIVRHGERWGRMKRERKGRGKEAQKGPDRLPEGVLEAETKQATSKATKDKTERILSKLRSSN